MNIKVADNISLHICREQEERGEKQMKQPKTFLLLSVIVAVLVLGIAYAAITAVNLTVTGNVTATPDQGNFKVAFGKADDESNKPTFSGTGTATLNVTGDLTATMDVTGFTKVNDEITVTFKILNTSDDISATLLAADPTNNNTEYFEVTKNLDKSSIAAVNGVATLTVTVRCIKTPLESQSATIGVVVTATPVKAS